MRSRLKDWTNLSLKTIRLRASVGKYAGYRRLSRWRVGPKLKSRVYYAYQKKCDVRSVSEIIITTVLFLEYTRAKRLLDRRLSKERRKWWQAQRLHGLCEAFRQECEARELKYLAERLKTPGGVAKLKRLLIAALPVEYRTTG
ncbi:MAG: hypothetical protein IIA67_00135 [Planctomycetes bacterium]|nr:hypothetical protein [Planctomycetota bacterium]